MDGSIYELLKQYDVSVVSHVPDAGHTALIRRCEGDAAMRTVTLTTEEEGIALAAGAWLGGARSVVLMQSSGVGNCCNLLALPRILAGPLLHADHDARRVGRGEPVAGADRQGRPGAARDVRRDRAPRRRAGGRRAGGRLGRWRWRSRPASGSPCCWASGCSAPRRSRRRRS